jgi:hypothetical protein
MFPSDKRRGQTHVNLDLDNLSPDEMVRVQRLARELRLTDQILSVDLDTVTVEANGPAPAWTSLEGDKISFNWSKMPVPFGRVDVAVWLGTNAHELGHVLFSPRKDSTLMFRVIESERSFLRGVVNMHNIVEDQRQERLLLARFSPWSGYLTAALGHHLVADDNNAWLLMCGRSWLPDEVRANAKARFTTHRSQWDTDEVTRLVGEYQVLADPGESDADEAWQILQDLVALFDAEQPQLPTVCVVMTGGEPDIELDPYDGPPTADEADAEPQPGQGKGDGDQDGEGDGDQDGDGDDDGDGDQPSDGEADKPSQGAGTLPGSKPIKSRDVKEALRKGAKAQIDRDDEAKGDLDSILDALDWGRGAGEEAEGERPIGEWVPADDKARHLRAEVSDALLDLKDETEPGWLRRVDSGRLNVRRLADPYSNTDELFDRYEPGMMDASEMEVVLLLDVSGSMAGRVGALGRSAWAIRHAVDDLEGTCTVITYESGPHRLLAEPGQRPDDRVFIPSSMGGTQPKSALMEALRVLAGSPAKNRILVILTDGVWAYPGWDRCDNIIESLNGMGATTVMALLGKDAGDNLHGCTYGAHIDQGEDLALLFRRVAAERIRSWR